MSDKPLLLDCMCGAGGCGEGYSQAGFELVGLDKEAQPDYPFEFHRADAFEVLPALLSGERWQGHRLGDFAAIHASPTCQLAFAEVRSGLADPSDHEEQIAPMRELLQQTGLPYVIENIPEAPIRPDFLLCGTMFALPIRRHRAFETNWGPDPVRTWGSLQPCSHHPDDYSFDHGAKQPESVYRDAMGCGWMTVKASRQAIPPAYTRFIGEWLMDHLNVSAEPRRAAA